MATFLDISLVNFLGPVFMFLLVFAIFFGILGLTRFLKGVPGEKGLYAIISLVVSLFVVIATDISNLLSTLAPWFAALIVFIFFVFVILKMFVGENANFFSDLLLSKDNQAIKWVLVVLFVLIVLISLSSTFGQKLTNQDPSTEGVVTTTTTNQYETTSQNYEVYADDTTTTYTTTQQPTYQSTPQQLTTTSTSSTNTGDFGTNMINTIVHPKVLGMLLFILIGFFTIILLSNSNN